MPRSTRSGPTSLDTIHLSEQWIVNGGMRFDDFERDQVGGRAACRSAQIPPANTAKVQADLFSWNVGIVYKPIPIASFYAAYATSESPIGSELDSTGRSTTASAPRSSTCQAAGGAQLEVGTKWELFTGACWPQQPVPDRRRQCTDQRQHCDVPTGSHRNAFKGEYRVRGIELGVAGNITETGACSAASFSSTPKCSNRASAGHRAKAGQHSADAVLAAVAATS